MASTYGYITVANLEAYTGIDYETTSATYTDAFVEATITMAERIVNMLCISAPSSTADGTIAATTILAARLMRNTMVVDGYAVETPQEIKRLMDVIIEKILRPLKYNPVDTVPMSGADRSSTR